MGFSIGFSALAFLPWFRDIQVLGVAAFGWLMAALLLGSPAILLLLLLSEAAPPAERDEPADRARSGKNP